MKWLIAAALLMTSASFAQEVKPASLTFEAVPGYTSPQQDVRLFNTGESEFLVTVSITGPFSIPTNDCGKEVKPKGHCDVWVTYSPTEVETDTGTLTFSLNDQTVSVPLTGDGVSLLPTVTKMKCQEGTCRPKPSEKLFKITVTAPDGYAIPDGEQVDISCVERTGIHRGTTVNTTGSLQDGVSLVSLSIPYDAEWGCSATYNGDAEFASSEGELHTVW
jgi:hypothetical protein